MKKHSDSVSYEARGRVGLILIDKPPVNAIDYSIRTGLVAAIEHAARDSATGIVLLACAGRTYMAGADISEFEGELKGPHLIEVLQTVEDCPKPVATVLFGTALGGGLETALACHYRAAVPTARMGLPELSLGVIPGAGGTQRMPRLIGARATLDMVLGIRPLDAAEECRVGFSREPDDQVDVDVGETGLADCLICAQYIRDHVHTPALSEHSVVELLDAKADAIDTLLTKHRQFLGVDAARSALESNFGDAMPGELSLERFEQAADLGCGEKRRRPAAEVDELHIASGEIGRCGISR